MNFSNILENYGEYKRLAESIENAPVSVAGLVDAAEAQLIYQLSRGKKAMVVAYSDMEAKAVLSNLKFFDKDTLYFPSKDYMFYNIDATARTAERERLLALSKIISSKSATVVTSVEAIVSYTLPKDIFSASVLNISVGDELDTEEFSEKLIKMGYVKEDMAEGVGQFSIRGGIIDVYSPNGDNPIRIELFDTEVDSIRSFDAESQRSLENCKDALIIPCREIMTGDAVREKIVKHLKNELKRLGRKSGDYEKLEENIKADLEMFENGEDIKAIDRYAPIIYEGIPTVAEYFDSDALIFLIEPKRIAERTKSLAWEEGELITTLTENGIPVCNKWGYYCDYKKLKERFTSCRLISLNPITHSSIDYQYNAIFNFSTRTTTSFHGKIEYLYEDLEKWVKEKYTVVILAANRSRAENLSGTLNDKGFDCRYEESGEFAPGAITVVRGELKKGFEYPEIKFVVISDSEIFDAQKSRRKRKMKNADRIKSYTDIAPGDYVVHQSHGIGQYMGINKMTVNGITKDYLKIQYNGSDILYVPVEQMDSLYKYIGSTDRKVKVNSLGGSEWSKTKAKVKKSTDDMAKQLVALYAERQNMKGYAFSSDTPWQRDFEDTFIYTETDDQLRSIEEVKADMEKSRPMDRLLCGDVGYGKTEVALRAAFKAVADSKQVAYLCPTTILAMQHYDTFCRRMADFPIKVEMLSRFRSPKQQADILKKLKTGEIDVIIGTHRLIQKDVEFRDLGLMIIDEEQRFGVADKEKLKEMKKDIDVLSMTATPIPRTLHMAMISVRDMSLLEEAPENRYPVQTYVLEYDDRVIFDAIRHEIGRGGQVFYLYNRVQGIYRVAERIKAAIPEARVAVGHGKMREDELEDIMYDMVEGKCDVLVCTTIIETGLDIPNANTIIIENADRMGLSQLYQLRGRVGRSNRSAYAYLTYRKDGTLSDVAQKRLKAISEFTEFGSGFKIAMRDLEIRGAGNILGAEQHGHMDAVGYDMYCKILQESVNTLQGKESQSREPATVDVQINAFIPERYIKNVNQRIDMYKKISVIDSEEEKAEMIDELIDRFGEPPKSVMNLTEIALIKSMATELGIAEVSVKENVIQFKFAQNAADPSLIVGLASKLPKQITIPHSTQTPTVIYRPKDKIKVIDNIKFILHEMFSLKNGEK